MSDATVDWSSTVCMAYPAPSTAKTTNPTKRHGSKHQPKKRAALGFVRLIVLANSLSYSGPTVRGASLVGTRSPRRL